MKEKTEERLVTKCPFCNLGEVDKRGVLEVQVSHFRNPNIPDLIEITAYKCALGDIGVQCSIPHSMQLSGMHIRAHQNHVYC